MMVYKLLISKTAYAVIKNGSREIPFLHSVVRNLKVGDNLQLLVYENSVLEECSYLNGNCIYARIKNIDNLSSYYTYIKLEVLSFDYIYKN